VSPSHLSLDILLYL